MQLEVLVQTMKTTVHTPRWALLAAGLLISVSAVRSQDNSKTPSSYMPVDSHESFSSIMNRMTAAKPEIMKRHMALLEQRYDLSNRPAPEGKMSGGRAIQQGIRVKLTRGTTWDQLSKLNPEQIKERSLYPAGFEPLPHPNHPEGGMLFPKFEIDEIKKQEGREPTRFDLDFDIPDHLLPEFPPPIYLTTRADLGDVSRGRLEPVQFGRPPEGRRTRNPVALTAGFLHFPAFPDTITPCSRLVDDRTDDRAFGADDVAPLGPKFKKLRFQMIADTVTPLPLGR